MNNIIKTLQVWCEQRKVEFKPIEETSDVKSFHIPHKYKNKAQHIGKLVKKLAIESYIHSFSYSLKEGIVIILSRQPITEEISSSTISEISSRNYKLMSNIEKAFDAEKAKIKLPPFKKLLENYNNKYQSSQSHDFNELLEASLQGIATQDNVQPKHGISALKNVLKATGLGAAMKKAGVAMDTDEGGHTITFSVNNVPVLAKNTIDLADESGLADLISELESIVRKTAPETGRMEAERAKNRESQAKEIAGQFAGQPQPEEI